jgi:hypothetical protein
MLAAAMTAVACAGVLVVAGSPASAANMPVNSLCEFKVVNSNRSGGLAERSEASAWSHLFMRHKDGFMVMAWSSATRGSHPASSMWRKLADGNYAAQSASGESYLQWTGAPCLT